MACRAIRPQIKGFAGGGFGTLLGVQFLKQGLKVVHSSTAFDQLAQVAKVGKACERSITLLDYCGMVGSDYDQCRAAFNRRIGELWVAASMLAADQVSINNRSID